MHLFFVKEKATGVKETEPVEQAIKAELVQKEESEWNAANTHLLEKFYDEHDHKKKVSLQPNVTGSMTPF